MGIAFRRSAHRRQHVWVARPRADSHGRRANPDHWSKQRIRKREASFRFTRAHTGTSRWQHHQCLMQRTTISSRQSASASPAHRRSKSCSACSRPALGSRAEFTRDARADDGGDLRRLAWEIGYARELLDGVAPDPEDRHGRDVGLDVPERLELGRRFLARAVEPTPAVVWSGSTLLVATPSPQPSAARRSLQRA